MAAAAGFSSKRLARLRRQLERLVNSDFVPGVMAVLARHGEVHVEAAGTLAFEGAGSATPIAGDTICRIASMTKPLVAACAMTLVEDCTSASTTPSTSCCPSWRTSPCSPIPTGHWTTPSRRNARSRCETLLVFPLGTGMVPAEPGTVPIADALDALGESRRWRSGAAARRAPDQPPGEHWMYETGADVTGVLIARATGMSFGDAVRERIFDPLGMKDTGFSVCGEDLGQLALGALSGSADLQPPNVISRRSVVCSGVPINTRLAHGPAFASSRSATGPSP